MSWRKLQLAACCLALLLTGPGAAQTFFTEVTQEAMQHRLFWGRSTAFGDYDNDGWPDLFLADDREPITRVALWHNEGNGRFTEWTVVTQAGLAPHWKGAGSIFGDYDNDGDLDLYVPIGVYDPARADQNVLLRNDRGGSATWLWRPA